MIDYFSKFKQEKLRDALELKYISDSTNSLEQFVQRKYDYLCYTMPALVERQPGYLIRMVIAASEDKTVRDEFAEMHSAHF